jgi:hypothetical protein
VGAAHKRSNEKKGSMIILALCNIISVTQGKVVQILLSNLQLTPPQKPLRFMDECKDCFGLHHHTKLCLKFKLLAHNFNSCPPLKNGRKKKGCLS